MGKECGAWLSSRLWGGGNTSPLKTTVWEAMARPAKSLKIITSRMVQVRAILKKFEGLG